MTNRQKGYMASIILIGAGILCSSVYNIYVSEPTFSALGNYIIMVILLAMCRMLPVYISEHVTIDLSFVPVVASALIYGSWLTIVMFAVSSLMLFLKDEDTGKYYYVLARAPSKELFNTANILFSIFLGGQILTRFGDWGAAFALPHSIMVAAGFSVVTIFANLLIFLGYFVVAGEETFFNLFSGVIGGVLPNIAATIPFGLLIAALLNQEWGSYYVLLFMLPLMLARYSFKLYLDAQSMQRRTIESLSRAIDAKDKYTRGHSQRVAEYAEIIAKEMKLPRKTIEELKTAALLHDIGKIGISDSVLKKEGALTESEYEEIKTHPDTGWSIIKEIRFSDEVNNAVRYHHLFYDGRGYPQNSETDVQLPLHAAILGVADAFDAMTSDRPYRKGMSKEMAMRILQENAGAQFHPEVVAAFLEAQESS